MGVDCRCYLPAWVRVYDVALVLGILSGLEKSKKPLISADGWYTEVAGVRVVSGGDSQPQCVWIDCATVSRPRVGVLYHFEPSYGKGRLLMPRSRPFWIAACRRLVDFFGGELDYNDCDESDIDYTVPAKPWEEISPEDGPAWQALQQRLFDLEPLSEEELAWAQTVAAYPDAEY